MITILMKEQKPNILNILKILKILKNQLKEEERKVLEKQTEKGKLAVVALIVVVNRHFLRCQKHII